MVYGAIDAAITEIEKLRQELKRGITNQVRASDELTLAKATVFAWFNTHRLQIPYLLELTTIKNVDELYQEILATTERAGKRSIYIERLKNLKAALVRLRTEAITYHASHEITTTDKPPDFSPLISDLRMQKILERRWNECTYCISAKAPLAAIVMMGGLLEALFLARINIESDQSFIFKAKRAPRDKSGKTLALKEWGLRDYIDVAHEVGWISQSAKDVGEVLRDYRNYIHPYKELVHKAEICSDDSIILWEVAKTLTRRILESK